MNEENNINIENIMELDTSLFKDGRDSLYRDIVDNFTKKEKRKNVVTDEYINHLTDEEKADIKNIMNETLDDVDSINNVIKILNKGNLNTDYNCFFIFKHYSISKKKPDNNEEFIKFIDQIVKAQKHFSNYF